MFPFLACPAPCPAAPSFGWERASRSSRADLRAFLRVRFPYTPAPARPAVPVGDGRAGAGMERWEAVSEGDHHEPSRWSAAPGSMRSEWYLRAFRGGCDYGGSGQVLRAALWYHSVRLRCHRAVGARLHGVQFCVWVSAAIAILGIPRPGLSVCALPGSFHPSPTPPPPPLSGGSGRGGVGWWMLVCARVLGLGFGWRWPIGATCLQLRGAAGT